MVIGIGTDLVRIDRFERAMARHGGRLLDRLFTPAERERFRRHPFPERHLLRVQANSWHVGREAPLDRHIVQDAVVERQVAGCHLTRSPGRSWAAAVGCPAWSSLGGRRTRLPALGSNGRW